MRLIIIAMMVLTMNNTVHAKNKYSLEDFIKMEIENNSNALENSNNAEQKKVNSKWILSRIRFRVRASVGIEVPFLAKLQIKPFVEFFWNK